MSKPKSANISFLILTILFVLSQTALVLSANWTGETAVSETYQNEIKADIAFTSDNQIVASNISDDNSSQIKELLEEKKFRKVHEKENLLMAATAVQTMTLVEPQADNESTQETAKPESTPQVKGVVKWVNANKLNVRSEPNSDSKLVQTIGRGDKVTYYETIGEWARIITWNDKKGYVLAKYLVNSANEVQKVVTETKTPSRGTTSSAPTAASAPQSAEGKSLAQQICDYAKTLQGVKYVWGGYSKSGLDCSGLTKYVYSHFGIYVPRSSGEYWSFGTKVERSNLQAGDIVLFDTDGGAADVSHVGIYLGGGSFIHASSSKGKVVIADLNSYRGKYMGARRVIK